MTTSLPPSNGTGNKSLHFLCSSSNVPGPVSSGSAKIRSESSSDCAEDASESLVSVKGGATVNIDDAGLLAEAIVVEGGCVTDETDPPIIKTCTVEKSV